MVRTGRRLEMNAKDWCVIDLWLSIPGNEIRMIRTEEGTRAIAFGWSGAGLAAATENCIFAPSALEILSHELVSVAEAEAAMGPADGAWFEEIVAEEKALRRLEERYE
jgi:hypothetical protein